MFFMRGLSKLFPIKSQCAVLKHYFKADHEVIMFSSCLMSSKPRRFHLGAFQTSIVPAATIPPPTLPGLKPGSLPIAPTPLIPISRCPCDGYPMKEYIVQYLLLNRAKITLSGWIAFGCPLQTMSPQWLSLPGNFPQGEWVFNKRRKQPCTIIPREFSSSCVLVYIQLSNLSVGTERGKTLQCLGTWLKTDFSISCLGNKEYILELTLSSKPTLSQQDSKKEQPRKFSQLSPYFHQCLPIHSLKLPWDVFRIWRESFLPCVLMLGMWALGNSWGLTLQSGSHRAFLAEDSVCPQCHFIAQELCKARWPLGEQGFRKTDERKKPQCIYPCVSPWRPGNSLISTPLFSSFGILLI